MPRRSLVGIGGRDRTREGIPPDNPTLFPLIEQEHSVAINRQQKDFTFDYATRLKDAGLVAASAAAQVGGSDKILDLGGAHRIDARVIVDVTACEVATGNEKYCIKVQGSSSSTFASAVWNLGEITLGDSSVSLESTDTAATRRQEIAFTNEVNGTCFRYIRIYTEVAGTIATGINFTADLVQKA
jgi:hypothetical protein